MESDLITDHLENAATGKMWKPNKSRKNKK